MVQSVELLLDQASDTAVRGQWDRLVAAGLPSQARHTGPSNAPHITLAVRRAIDPALEPALRVAVDVLPLRLRLGSVACFGHRQVVLVRLVVPKADLLALHAAVADALGPDPDGMRNLAPGEWTPHVTLARRLSPEQVGTAVLALDGPADVRATAVACRRWDGDARDEWSLGH